MKLHFLPLLAVSLLFGSISNAQVIISEIHYHPVEEPAFLANGAPALDLTDDVHEFVELQNVGASQVDLSGWKLTNGIDFIFPANTTIPASGFRVVAKNPARLASVYALQASSVLGPFTGKLSNDSDTVQLKDANGSTVDSVAYSAKFPWAQTADGLGAGQDWTGINPLLYQYKGRSLQRVSTTASSNDPANWLASPLSPGPTPGGPQAVTRSVPKPVVTGLNVEQATNGEPLIRNNSAARINCTFSSTAALSNVSVEYFVDDINATTETRSTAVMNSVGNGEFTVDLPVRPDRSVVRYRIRANRGDGVEVVSPRADDPAVVPVAGGQREAWHAYFVTPVRTSTKPIYDCFISNTSLSTLSTNITQNPRRVTPDGYPRDEIWVRPTDPQWNGTQPAIMIHDGVVYDIIMRHHGSRYRREVRRNSFKWQFPRNNLFLGTIQGIFETDKNVETGTSTQMHTEWGHRLHRLAGIPTSYTQRIDLYLNTNAVLERLEQSENDDRLLEQYYAEQHLLDPSQPLLEPGEIYKAKGTDEGPNSPYRTSYGEPLSPRTAPAGPSPSGKTVPGGVWTDQQQYSYNYTLQDHNWKAHKQFKEMIDALDVAKNGGNPALRTYLSANWDVDKTLTYIALRNWGCPWDDHFHNYYLHRQANGKWMMMPWDFDYEFSDRSSAQDIYFTTNNHFKEYFINAFRTEFKEKMFLLNNTLLAPSNLVSLGINWGSWQNDRFNNVNSQLGLGTFFRPNKPLNQAPGSGASALPPAMLTASTYSHTGGTPTGVRAHAKSKWELREADGTWNAPFIVETSTTNLTSIPIPFDRIKWGETYFWRVTYFDAQSHPSITSEETPFAFGPGPTVATLIAMDAATTWKYNDTAQFFDQTWTEAAYDDGGWLEGVPVFGLTTTPNLLTALNPPQALRTNIPLNLRTAFYFRKHCNFPGSVNGATLKITQIIDDGVVVYLNGHEVLRVGMNATAVIDYNSKATRSVSGYFYEGPLPIPTTWLLPGDNVLAVEVHQVSATNNDFIMGMQLEGSYQAQGETVALNEICANNRSIISNGGQQPDYLELYNNTAAAIDLGGWGLTDDVLVPNKYLFPAGTLIPAQGYLVVWADNDFGAPGLHTGFALDAGGQTVVLTQGGTIRDAVSFGPLPPDLSIGHPIDGTGAWLLVAASPNAPNLPKTLGSAATLKINEWMVDPISGDDWFEIYNPDANPVSLAGLWLSDTPGSPMITQVPPLSFIAGHGFARFDADGKTRGFSSVNFKLAAGGESIVLTNTNGTTTIDSVTFGIQTQGVSRGRLPDGSASIVSFPSTASPSASNWLPLPSVVINEALSASPSPLEDVIELFNPTAASVDISGWWLSDSADDFRKYQIPPGTVLADGDFRVFNEHDFNSGAAGSFALDGIGGDSIYLSQADAGGNLTGYRLQVDFDAAESGTSFGRIVTAAGDDFAALTAFTPDAANAPPKIGPVIINEIMYHPPDLPGGIDDTVDEFIELQNITPHSVPLFDPANPANSWKLRFAVSFSFPPNASIPPGGCALVVSFNPANSAQLSAFQTKYHVGSGVRVFGPWSGKLANDGDRLELLKPLSSVNGTVPYVLVEKVVYGDASPWPSSGSSTGPDGFGQSLQRLARSAYGNDPANWTAALPSAGLDNPTQPPLIFLADSDGDGVPDYWEDENGLNKNDPADAALDDDGDGRMGVQEYVAGTDPHNAASALTAAVASVAGGFQIRFTAMPDRTYSVLSCDNLHGGTWIKVSDVPAGAISRVVEVLDLTAVPQRFYKVATPAQP